MLVVRRQTKRVAAVPRVLVCGAAAAVLAQHGRVRARACRCPSRYAWQRPHVPAEPQCKFFQEYVMDTHELGNGAYRLRRVCGKHVLMIGSTVHRCTRKTTGEAFAVKIVSSIKSNPRREVEVLRKAQGLPAGTRACIRSTAAGHRHIVKLVDVFEDARHVYIVTELLHGGADRSARTPPQRCQASCSSASNSRRRSASSKREPCSGRLSRRWPFCMRDALRTVISRRRTSFSRRTRPTRT